MSESELDDLMGEVGGPCNVTGMINMFQEKMAGDGNDPDELILQAFMAYDLGGKIDVKMFQHALRTWGDKMSNAEIDDIFEQFYVDEDYMVKTKEVVGLFVAVKEKEEEKKEEVVEAAPEEEGDDAKKKKKKKKKAAKYMHFPKCDDHSADFIKINISTMNIFRKSQYLCLLYWSASPTSKCTSPNVMII